MSADGTDVAMLLAILDEATTAAYRAMRDLGLTIDAAKDAITVHVSDTLIPLAVREHQLAGEHDDGGGGGVACECSP